MVGVVGVDYALWLDVHVWPSEYIRDNIYCIYYIYSCMYCICSIYMYYIYSIIGWTSGCARVYINTYI
jgi:hypothetical protein